MLLRTRTTNSNWIAHARRHNHECNSHGGHECIGMRSQSAGKPEMMLREVATCHTIVDTNTLLMLCRIIRQALTERKSCISK
jgi:hypothetical protein